MSLKEQLQKGLLAALAVIIIFIIMTSKSYIDLDSFVTEKLPHNIELARQYERVANYWHLIGQQAQNLVRDSYKTVDYKPWEEKIEKALEIISKAQLDKTHKEKANEIRHEYSHYIKSFASLERLIINRTNIHNQNTAKRSAATKNMKKEIEVLMKSFKDMITDLQNSVKSSDFQASLSGATFLLDKIKRIESDLIISEKEVALYLNPNQSNPSAVKSTRKNSSSRVEQRLRAILYLIERSNKEIKNSVQKRVLTKIGTSVKSFSNSFNNLRNIIEASDSDVLELDDQIIQTLTKMEDIEQLGIDIASKEAEYFWERIESVSAEQIELGSNSYKLIGIFLALVFFGGIFLTIQMPKAIAVPLKNLSEQIANFNLDSKAIELPKSDITEIDNLNKDFSKMAKTLNTQGEINSANLDYIRALPSIINKLHSSVSSWNQEEQKEEAVISILQSLMNNCPKIDLAKVMVFTKRTTENQESKNLNEPEEFFYRLGDPVFSDSFKDSEEYKIYCESTGYKGPGSLEILPKEEGLCGWYYENNEATSPNISSLQNKFFQSEYSPQKIIDNPILKNRKYELGLNGCLKVELLKVPGREDELKSKDYGLLFVYFKNPNIKLSWQEIFFIQIIAGHIAFIIETASLLKDHDEKKLMDDQLMVAQEIQENLLPKRVPKINGLKICKAWKPAAEVGGDYYDFFKIGKSRIGIVIADASGKNVTGAMLMTVFKTTLSTMNLAEMSASEVLFRANNIISGNITSDKFITAMYIIVDSESGEVELSSAGHNPAFIASSYGRDFSLASKNSKGLPLGIMEDYSYESINFKLNKKDMLIMYTDGVTESRNINEEEFGESGLKKFLQKPRSSKGDPAATLVNTVLSDFSEGTKQHDDITVITVELC